MKALSNWLLTIMLFVAVGFVGFYSYKQQLFKVDHVDIELLQNSSLFGASDLPEKIALSLKDYNNQWIWDVDLQQVINDVLKDKRVESVKVQRRFPAQLDVKIKPQSALALILDDNQKWRPVFFDASVWSEVSRETIPDLPILRGSKFLKDEALRKKVVNLLMQLPDTGVFGKNQISEIEFFKHKGFVLHLNRPMQVLIGDSLDDFQSKVPRIQKVLSYLESKGMSGRVIDARLSKKVVVKLRNDS